MGAQELSSAAFPAHFNHGQPFCEFISQLRSYVHVHHWSNYTLYIVTYLLTYLHRGYTEPMLCRRSTCSKSYSSRSTTLTTGRHSHKNVNSFVLTVYLFPEFRMQHYNSKTAEYTIQYNAYMDTKGRMCRHLHSTNKTKKCIKK